MNAQIRFLTILEASFTDAASSDNGKDLMLKLERNKKEHFQ